MIEMSAMSWSMLRPRWCRQQRGLNNTSRSIVQTLLSSVKTALQQMSKTHEVDETSNHQSCSVLEEQSKVGLEVPVSTTAEEH